MSYGAYITLFLQIKVNLTRARPAFNQAKYVRVGTFVDAVGDAIKVLRLAAARR